MKGPVVSRGKVTKADRLRSLLKSRGIDVAVWYRRKHPIGWMAGDPDGHYDRIGYTFSQAVDLILDGTMDFLAEARVARGGRL